MIPNPLVLEKHGVKMRFVSHNGVVIDSNRGTQTSTTISGGGGYVGRNGGYVKPARVTTRSNFVDTIWLKTESGEKSFTLPDCAVRKGSTVSVVTIQINDSGISVPNALIKNNENSYQIFDSHQVVSLNVKNIKWKHKAALVVLLAFIAGGYVIGPMTDNDGYFWGPIIGAMLGLLPALSTYKRQVTRLKSAIESETDKLCNDFISNNQTPS